MPLVAAGLLPYTPLLLPGLTAAGRKRLQKTTAAIRLLTDQLVQAKTETLLLLATRTVTTALAQSYALIQAPELSYVFTEFGDLVTRGSRRFDVSFTHRLKERCETTFPIPLATPLSLPFTFAIPLACLGASLAEIPIACLQLPSQPTLEELNKLGSILIDHLHATSTRTAVLAVGTLAHHEQRNASRTKILDQHFQVALAAGSREQLLNLDPGLRAQSGETIWAPATLLYSLLANHRAHIEPLAYETPLNVGLITASITLA